MNLYWPKAPHCPLLSSRDIACQKKKKLLSLTLCSLTHYSLPGSLVRVILQARMLEWVAFPFSGGFSRPRYWIQWSNLGLLHYRQILYHLSHQGSPICCQVKVKVPQCCPALCDPMDYTVHGILQAGILEWVAIRFSSGSSQPRD